MDAIRSTYFLPIFAGMCLGLGAIAGSTLTTFSNYRVAKIADRNLLQAERLWMACHKSQPYVVGSAIYVPRTKLSVLTTADVPELQGVEPATPGSAD